MTRPLRASGVVGTSADGRHDLVVHRTGMAPGPQGRLAFAVLVVERRALTREHLARLVRDDAPPDAWSPALSSVLSTIRQLVPRAGLDGRAVVSSAGGSCGIRLPAGPGWTSRTPSGAPTGPRARCGTGTPLPPPATPRWPPAVLRRPFLPGVAGEWAEGRRALADEALLRCLVTLATARNELGVAPSPETSALVEGLR